VTIRRQGTDHGQTVPTLGAGDTVRVRTATGTLASGILRSHHHMMENANRPVG
jgi:hypothetical protein